MQICNSYKNNTYLLKNIKICKVKNVKKPMFNININNKTKE